VGSLLFAKIERSVCFMVKDGKDVTNGSVVQHWSLRIRE
jgi:hypothetical protein